MNDTTNVSGESGLSEEMLERKSRRVRRIILYLIAALVCIGVGAIVVMSKMSADTKPVAQPPAIVPENQVALTEVMSQFPGQRISLAVADDPRSIEMAQLLLPIISTAKWEMINRTPKVENFAEPDSFNVMVNPEDEKGEKTPKAAQVLATKLKQLGLTSSEKMGTDRNLAPGELGLRVRAKPEAK